MAKSFGKWNKRWYVLRKNKLHNFKEKGHKTEKGNIPLKTVESVTRITNIKKLSIPDKFKDMVFELRSQNKTFFFVASDPASMEKWVTCLELSRQMFAASGVYYFTNAKDKVSAGSQRALRFSFSLGGEADKGRRGKGNEHDQDEDEEIVIVSQPSSDGVPNILKQPTKNSKLDNLKSSTDSEIAEQEPTASEPTASEPTVSEPNTPNIILHEASNPSETLDVLPKKFEVIDDPDPEPLSLTVWEKYFHDGISISEHTNTDNTNDNIDNNNNNNDVEVSSTKSDTNPVINVKDNTNNSSQLLINKLEEEEGEKENVKQLNVDVYVNDENKEYR